MTILAGSGSSNLDDAYEAGRHAAAAAVAPLHGRTAGLALVFTTDDYDQAAVLRGCRAITGSTGLIGCCTGGLITRQGILSAGVAVLALAGDDLEVTLAMEPGLSARPALAAEGVAEQLEMRLPPHGSGKTGLALTFTDGLTGALAMDEAIQTATTVLGPLCPLFGGAAGDSLKYDRTSLFIDDQIANDAIAMALLSISAPIGIGVRHGWDAMGQQTVITRSAANVIYELDGRPALDAYRDLFPDQQITVENFREFTRYHPIGFPQANGEFLVRLPLDVSPDGSIACVGMLPSHAIAHIMRGDPESLLAAARLAARRAVAALEGQEPAAAIVIDCVTRPPLLGESTSAEICAIREVLGEQTPIIGMYSFGEIAADDGPVCFHNKTVAVCVIGRGA